MHHLLLRGMRARRPPHPGRCCAADRTNRSPCRGPSMPRHEFIPCGELPPAGLLESARDPAGLAEHVCRRLAHCMSHARPRDGPLKNAGASSRPIGVIGRLPSFCMYDQNWCPSRIGPSTSRPTAWACVRESGRRGSAPGYAGAVRPWCGSGPLRKYRRSTPAIPAGGARRHPIRDGRHGADKRPAGPARGVRQASVAGAGRAFSRRDRGPAQHDRPRNHTRRMPCAAAGRGGLFHGPGRRHASPNGCGTGPGRAAGCSLLRGAESGCMAAPVPRLLWPMPGHPRRCRPSPRRRTRTLRPL